VLKSLGFAVDEVVARLRTLSEARGKRPGWPESPWQRALVERYSGSGTPCPWSARDPSWARFSASPSASG